MEDNKTKVDKSIEIIAYLHNELSKEKTLNSICEKFDISEWELYGYISKLKDNGFNIDHYAKDGETYLVRNEHPDLSQVNTYKITCDVNETKKIAVISDIRAGSKCEQFRIINDMFVNFQKQGVTDVFVLGNLIEGKYTGKTFQKFGKSLITNDGIAQTEHFIDSFPHIDGITIHIITGNLDHSFPKQLNVGEYIASKRDDIVYLGPKSCNVMFNNVSIHMEQVKDGSAYTISYPIQKYVRSMSNSEKYDVLMLSGEMNYQYFPELNGMQVFSIPSCVSRTPLMIDNNQSNTIASCTFEIEFNKNGKLKRLVPMVSTYEPVNTRYYNFKKLNLVKDDEGNLISSIIKDNNSDYSELHKIYNMIHREEDFESLRTRLHIKEDGTSLTENELYGIVSRLREVGLEIEIVDMDGGLIVRKKMSKPVGDKDVKPPMEELHKKTFGVISDTHYGSIFSQPSMVNTFVYECYNRGIDLVYHCGDICDGDYARIRPKHPYEVHEWGPSGQLYYVAETLPKYKGLFYRGITASHDETHLFNYGFNFGEKLAEKRKDFTFLGQDRAFDKIDNCTVELFHPGGGTSRIVATKPQNRLDQVPPTQRVDLSLWGHYHKNYEAYYANEHIILLPCNVDTSSFMMKNQIPNLMGDYFITIYYDDNGKIHYIIPEAMVFDINDVRKNDWENPKKYIKNKILTPRTPIIK